MRCILWTAHKPLHIRAFCIEFDTAELTVAIQRHANVWNHIITSPAFNADLPVETIQIFQYMYTVFRKNTALLLLAAAADALII